MRVHIVTASDWILKEIADNFTKHMPDCTVSTSVDKMADINFFINYALWEYTGGKTASYFTHREGEDFDTIAQESDVNISMCEITYQKVLRAAPMIPSYIVKPGISEIYTERVLQIGVVGREYTTGRKRLDWLDKLRQIGGIEIIFTNGAIPVADMPGFYAMCDYILVTGSNEGGPLPVLEAIACGKPLIIPIGVGWCDDYLGIRYGSFEELEGILRGLVYNHDTYKEGADRLIEIFSGLY